MPKLVNRLGAPWDGQAANALLRVTASRRSQIRRLALYVLNPLGMSRWSVFAVLLAVALPLRDHIPQLADKVRIATQLEGLRAMGLGTNASWSFLLVLETGRSRWCGELRQTHTSVLSQIYSYNRR